MSKHDTGSGGPVNKTTKVGTKNAGYTIVASVRLHSDGGSRPYEEDKMICLGVNENTGEMICWERFWVEERGDSNGWSSGRYQPYRPTSNDKELEEAKNCATMGFKDRVKWEMDACVARAFSRRDDALQLKPSIDETMPEDK